MVVKEALMLASGGHAWAIPTVMVAIGNLHKAS